MMYIEDNILLKEKQKEKKVLTSSKMNGSDGESRSASSNENMLEHKHLNVQSLSPPATTTPSNLLPPESPPRSRLLASPGSIQPTFLSIPPPTVTISSNPFSSTLSQSSSHPAQSLPAEDDFLSQRLAVLKVFLLQILKSPPTQSILVSIETLRFQPC